MPAPTKPGEPPPELTAAIGGAATAYDVPPDLLTGIWRVETGGRYPNPYVNSAGYGGLFGTANTTAQGAPFPNFDIAASTEQQADEAAKILQRLLASEGGSIQAALEDYSGHSYGQVPGETTFGYWLPRSSPAATVGGGLTTPAQAEQAAAANPQQPSGCDRSGASFSGCFCGIAGGGVGGGIPVIGGAIKKATGAAEILPNFFTKATPCLAAWAYAWLQRLGLLLAAALLAAAGIYLLAREAGIAPEALPVPE